MDAHGFRNFWFYVGKIAIQDDFAVPGQKIHCCARTSNIHRFYPFFLPRVLSFLASQIDYNVSQRLKRFFRLGLQCEDANGVGRYAPGMSARSMP
jgi:hypothetical protein